jgi:hypothetical protein
VSRPRPVILLAFANDRVDGARWLRDLHVERKRLQEAMRDDVGERELGGARWEVCVLEAATLDEIVDAFQRFRDRVVVFHYGGHADGYDLLLETTDGGSAAADGQALAAFLGRQQGLRLVFLNACSTEANVRDLLAARVGAVIATSQTIDDRVATDFSARFYRGLASGASLGQAYAEAGDEVRAALRTPHAGAYRAERARRLPATRRRRGRATRGRATRGRATSGAGRPRRPTAGPGSSIRWPAATTRGGGRWVRPPATRSSASRRSRRATCPRCRSATCSRSTRRMQRSSSAAPPRCRRCTRVSPTRRSRRSRCSTASRGRGSRRSSTPGSGRASPRRRAVRRSTCATAVAIATAGFRRRFAAR